MGSKGGLGTALGAGLGFAVGGPIGAAIGAGIGGNIGAGMDSQDAANQQVRAAREANETQRYIFEQQRADAAPWREAGVGALGQLTAGTAPGGDYMRDFTLADFQADPGYQFRMQEGMKALEHSAAARGSLNSGATLKALTRYGQDFASNEFQNAYNRFNADRDRRFNRLSSLAGIGQTANAQVAQAGQNFANQYGQNVIGAANAQAAATMQQNQMNMQMIGMGIGAYGGSQGWFRG